MRNSVIPFFTDDPRRLVAIAFVIVAYLMRRYWLVPYRLLGTRFPRGESNARVVESEAELPPDARTYLEQTRAALATLGFTPTAVIADGSAIARMFVQRFEDPSNTVIATVVTSFRVKDGQVVKLFRKFTAFESRGARGNEVKTIGHSGSPGIPDRPTNSVARLPEDDIAMLFRLHGAHLKQAALQPAQYRIGDPAAFQKRLDAEAERWATECGWFRNVGDFRQRTLRGACVATWRQLAPWKWLISRRETRLWTRLYAEAMGANTLIGFFRAMGDAARGAAAR